MTDDSRRYHRRRGPRARAYGLLGSLGSAVGEGASAVGSGLESAAGAVGSGLESAAGAVGGGLESAGSALFGGGGGAGGAGAGSSAGGTGSTLGALGNFLVNKATGGLAKPATSAFGDLSQGIQSLFGGGGDEAGYLRSLGQPVPQGVELAGPSSTFAGPGFLDSFAHGFMHDAPKLANPSASTSLGKGLGEVASMLDQLNAQSASAQKPLPPQPIIPTGTGAPIRPLQLIAPANTGTVGPGPILGGLLGHL